MCLRRCLARAGPWERNYVWGRQKWKEILFRGDQSRNIGTYPGAPLDDLEGHQWHPIGLTVLGECRSHCGMQETHATKTYGWICQGVMTPHQNFLFQTISQRGLVLIILEHWPSAENVRLESYFSLRATCKVGLLWLWEDVNGLGCLCNHQLWCLVNFGAGIWYHVLHYLAQLVIKAMGESSTFLRAFLTCTQQPFGQTVVSWRTFYGHIMDSMH